MGGGEAVVAGELLAPAPGPAVDVPAAEEVVARSGEAGVDGPTAVGAPAVGAAGAPLSVRALSVASSATRPPPAGRDPSGDPEPPDSPAIAATVPATPSTPATTATRRRPPLRRCCSRRRPARPSPGPPGPPGSRCAGTAGSSRVAS